MTKRYQPTEIEAVWQKTWRDTEAYKAEDFAAKPKYVMLTEFPYPSGDGLHIGHVREYVAGDIISRHKRAKGFNVLYPMGYDAFGLPTENYAIKNQVSPQEATATNVANFRRQFDRLGLSFDWSREINTTDPKYYKWTQWLFLQFFKAGLAHEADIDINWCPKCKTGLANEEVVDGKHERCDTPVSKKRLKQWVLEITKFADSLIDGLNTVDYSPRIATQQVNWIGRSHGAEIDFKLQNSEREIKVFSTRADTLAGATFMAVAPEYADLREITGPEQWPAVEKYLQEVKSKSNVERQLADRPKTGVDTGARAINPITKKAMPIFVADYVLADYGFGALMAVPAHDERDFAFAKAFDLPIVEVIKPTKAEELPYAGAGKLVNSGEYDGLESVAAAEKIIEDLAKSGLAKPQTNYRLHDWIFSRQHYWGEPIPIIHCAKCGAVPVPEEDLPVELPKVDHYHPTDTGESPLAEITDWVNTTCPKCGGAAKRETDTMPNWAGSSWYYLRYFDPHNDQVFADPAKLNYWNQVDMYLGGMEHTTLHLLYSRFWHQFLHQQGLVPTAEPYARRRGQGIILAADGVKMSKSLGNVVNPDEVIDSGYGADSLRLAISFLAPYDMTTAWNPESVPGMYRFLNRVWNLNQEIIANQTELKPDVANMALDSIVHRAIEKVDADLSNMNFNTAIAAIMTALNELYKLKTKGWQGDWVANFGLFLQLLEPFAPHLAHQAYLDLMGEQLKDQKWPQFDPSKLVEANLTLGVQVDGKLRSQISFAADLDSEAIKQLALNDEKVQAFLADKLAKKVIYVPKRIVNIVTK